MLDVWCIHRVHRLPGTSGHWMDVTQNRGCSGFEFQISLKYRPSAGRPNNPSTRFAYSPSTTCPNNTSAGWPNNSSVWFRLSSSTTCLGGGMVQAGQTLAASAQAHLVEMHDGVGGQ